MYIILVWKGLNNKIWQMTAKYLQAGFWYFVDSKVIS